MPKLNWISDHSLDAAISKFRAAAARALEESVHRQRRNVIDPFLSLLIADTFGANSQEELLRLQNSNSALNGMPNALGYFHQEVLGEIPGWVNHDAGYDLECAEKRILAEVKNKHNTLNSKGKDKVISELDIAVRQKRGGWKGYLVIVVPKTPARYEIRAISNRRPVFVIDGASFYHKATDDPNALHDLFDILCDEFTNSQEISDYCRQIMAESIPPRI